MSSTIADAIMRRQSVRNYVDSPIKEEHMLELERAVKGAKALYPDISVDIKIIKDGKKLHGKGFIGGYGAVNAPHYLVVTSETKNGYHENVGFTLEQIVLKLTTMGIGTCWLGRLGKKEIEQICEIKPEHQGVISVAFGYPNNKTDLEPKRLDDRNRKNISGILFGDYSSEIQDVFHYVMAAPSGINAQKTRYYVYNDIVHIYTDKGLIKSMENMYLLDAGIAMCHLCLICAEKEHKISVQKEEQPTEIKGKKYVTSIKFIS